MKHLGTLTVDASLATTPTQHEYPLNFELRNRRKNHVHIRGRADIAEIAIVTRRGKNEENDVAMGSERLGQYSATRHSLLYLSSTTRSWTSIRLDAGNSARIVSQTALGRRKPPVPTDHIRLLFAFNPSR